MRPKLSVSTLVAAAVMALLPVAPFITPAAAQPVAAPAVPTTAVGYLRARKRRCPGRGFECAMAHLPLDYRDPGGRMITLSLVRRPATGPGTRLGTLFLNPGGPGSTGTEQIPGWIGFLPNGLQQWFDVVSWDPRGVGESTGVQCFDSA